MRSKTFRNRHYPREHFLNVHADGPGSPFAIGVTVQQFGAAAHIALRPGEAEALASEILEICKAKRRPRPKKRKPRDSFG